MGPNPNLRQSDILTEKPINKQYTILFAYQAKKSGILGKNALRQLTGDDNPWFSYFGVGGRGS